MKTLLVILLLSSTSTIAAPSDQENIRALVEIVKVCADKADNTNPVFHGCVDWHSAVHGYWALLWGAQVLKDKELATSALNQLSKSRLSQEMINFQRRDHLEGAHFEMPYGRSWFLQLARDAEVIHGFRGLRPLADYLYATLLKYARENNGELAATEYNNASWYLYQLYQWAKYNNYKNDEAELRRIVIGRFSQPIQWPLFVDNSGFFEPKALAALLLSAMNKPEPSWTNLVRAIDAESLQPRLPPYRTAHQGGLNYSRSWGLVALAQATSEPRYYAAAQQHRNVMSENIGNWGTRYREYGHWVAQFGMFSYRIEYENQ